MYQRLLKSMNNKKVGVTMRKKISILSPKDINSEVTIKGWVRSVRDQKEFAFVIVNDGSNLSGIQVVFTAENNSNYEDIVKNLTNGCSVAITGTLVESIGKGQSIELKAHTIEIIGTCDPEVYPLQKKRHSFEFLRTIAHLRPRTNTFGAVARVRNALSYATHKFFQESGFLYLHTPIITGSDTEGAGELFNVTTIDMQKSPKINDHIDFSKDFFGKQAFLTVSGQLQGEAYACALSDIYTFGPTFRAENSNTTRHLAEFWMIEPEMAFAQLSDDMACAESYLKYCFGYVLNNCHEDMVFFDTHVNKGIIERLENVIKNPFERITYTQAIDILKASGNKFEFPVDWDAGLQSEHERYLTEKQFGKPVIVYNYPQKIKAFYMRLNNDQKTVAAMDVLVPGVGEIIGGSQREDRLEYLERRLDQMGLPKEHYWWYNELRKYGSVPHAGFGLGLERLVLYCTGMENIRDVIPFPRYPGHVEF